MKLNSIPFFLTELSRFFERSELSPEHQTKLIKLSAVEEEAREGLFRSIINVFLYLVGAVVVGVSTFFLIESFVAFDPITCHFKVNPPITLPVSSVELLST